MLKRWFLGSMAAFAALLLSIPAGAIGVGAGGAALIVNGTPVDLGSCETTAGGTLCSGAVQGDTFQIDHFDLAFNADPFVLLALGVINGSASPQTFNFTAVVPVAPVGPGLTLNGSISGSLTDGAADGASLVDTGAPIYAAIIDGAPVRTLLDPPQAFSTTTSTTFGPAAFGPEVFAGSAGAFIAMQIQFTLSPGDAASFSSVFDVVPVPEPGTLMLVASGIAGIAARGRRRSA